MQPKAIDDWYNYSAGKFKQAFLPILHERFSYHTSSAWINCLIVSWLWDASVIVTAGGKITPHLSPNHVGLWTDHGVCCFSIHEVKQCPKRTWRYSVLSKTVLALKSEHPERHYWQGGRTQSPFPAPRLVKELHTTSLMLINLLS